ncbi:MAG: HAMP domain-containing histidine kinase [Acidimicrobiia bacterium]|nr:HAMP domain-containing histidine kinase [Acidimicrobiia bacterium]
MSLRLRVTLFLALAVAVAVAAVSWAAYASAEHEARAEIDQALLGRALPEGMAGGQSFIVSSGALPVLPQPFPEGGVEFRPDVVVQFVDASGGVFAPFAGGVALPVEEEDLAIAVGGGGPLLRDVRVEGVHYRMVTTQAVAFITVAAGQPAQATPMALQVARELTETDAFLGGLRTRLILIGGSAVVLAAVLAWFASRRAVRPVAVLTKAAEHVAATRDLEIPIEVTRRDEIGRLAASFNTMLAALAASRAQQRRLVADAGHELRTPLTSLRTNIEVLARVGDLPPADRDELLADARQELEELSALVAEVVDLAADAPPEETVTVRWDELVADAVDRFRRRTGREVVLDVEETVFRGQPGRLERAVGNLLDNAGKFSPPGEPVEVTLRGGRLEVRDHGLGIDPEDLPRVFERFYRAVGARTTPGSGLGLAIVEEVAQEHGGRAFAANAEGGGAVVGFEVPVKGAATDGAE